MDDSFKAGLTLVGLAVAIILGLVALTLQGQPYMILADIVFGFVAAGLLSLGVYLVAQRNTQTGSDQN
jgi:high-affinity Fe2+/Pb2+ permease